MFKGKVVIVTGSSAGIGAHLAERFAKEQASGLVIHGRKEAALHEVKQRCIQESRGATKVHIVTGDIGEESVQQKLIKETVHHFGKLDILVNNAALYDPRTFFESPMTLFDKLFAVNVRSLIALCQIAAPELIKTKGNIVNVSSDVGVKPVTWAMFYALSKSTIDHFTKCLAVELGPKGVRVNAVNPGFFPDTDVLSRAGINENDQQWYVTMASEAYPLGRTGKLDEVADTITYLASDQASFVTGMLMPVDGGNLAKVART